MKRKRRIEKRNSQKGNKKKNSKKMKEKIYYLFNNITDIWR